uniref:Uncharacterized protein n=1 Tax=Rhizophora mucronata TaxID=61149 RepID=A0A2P2IT66_RHIMU
MCQRKEEYCHSKLVIVFHGWFWGDGYPSMVFCPTTIWTFNLFCNCLGSGEKQV